jgi:hypothetical protein
MTRESWNAEKLVVVRGESSIGDLQRVSDNY